MLVHVDSDRLVELARRADVVLRVLRPSADWCPPARRWCASKACRSTTPPRRSLDTERSLAQDLAYGPRLLVDICVRSLKEPFDPTTAVQAIDRIHDFLRRLATRKFPTGEYRDETGTLRLVIGTLTWDDYVFGNSPEEIRIGSAFSVQAIRRLRYCLEDLLDYAPQERRAPIARQLHLLDSESRHNEELGEGLPEVAKGDPQGLGRSRDRRAVN